MRYHFFWDQPYPSVVAFFYQFFLTLMALSFVLATGILARRRIKQARLGWSEFSSESTFNGAVFASEILKSGTASGWMIVKGTGPLANFADPFRRELRLSEGVAGGRTIEALAIASHQAGHILADSRNCWRSRARVTLILGSKLAILAAWLTLLAGALMLSPALTDRGALLAASTVLTLLVLQVFEGEANRRALLTIREASLDEAWTTEQKQGFARVLEAARWVEIASTLPLAGGK
jgi:Zn-dependent membrane protease YugP